MSEAEFWKDIRHKARLSKIAEHGFEIHYPEKPSGFYRLKRHGEFVGYTRKGEFHRYGYCTVGSTINRAEKIINKERDKRMKDAGFTIHKSDIDKERERGTKVWNYYILRRHGHIVFGHTTASARNIERFYNKIPVRMNPPMPEGSYSVRRLQHKCIQPSACVALAMRILDIEEQLYTEQGINLEVI